MNEIIEKLIEWCFKNQFQVSITSHDYCGGKYIILILGRGKKKISHEFYYGDVPNAENWKFYRCDLELSEFIKEAEAKLGE